MTVTVDKDINTAMQHLAVDVIPALKNRIAELEEKLTSPIITSAVSNSLTISANSAVTATWTIPAHEGYTPKFAVCDNAQSTGIVCTVCNITSATTIYCSFRNVTGTGVTKSPEINILYIKNELL